MVRVSIVGQGYVATTFAVGLEKIKDGMIKPYGVPLGDKLSIPMDSVEIVGSIDVDTDKIGKNIFEIAKGYWEKVPEQLQEITVEEGVEFRSLKNLPVKSAGLDRSNSVSECIDLLVQIWKSQKPDIIVNTITTEVFLPFKSEENIIECIESNKKNRFSATQIYVLAAAKYASRTGGAAFINVIPTLIANDPVMVDIAEKSNLVIVGDDGATGATPLTSDLVMHQFQRNRHILDIAQFNIGGNMDFLALTDDERNRNKEFTKSGVVKDILGYAVPTYIKPTGYLEPLGDKKFIAMHMEYMSFNGVKDELVITGRINDSPALAGLLVDLVRLGKIAVENEEYGTVFDINAFYMKNPGPSNMKSIPRIIAYEKMKKWAGIGSDWL